MYLYINILDAKVIGNRKGGENGDERGWRISESNGKGEERRAVVLTGGGCGDVRDGRGAETHGRGEHGPRVCRRGPGAVVALFHGRAGSGRRGRFAHTRVCRVRRTMAGRGYGGRGDCAFNSFGRESGGTSGAVGGDGHCGVGPGGADGASVFSLKAVAWRDFRKMQRHISQVIKS